MSVLKSFPAILVLITLLFGTTGLMAATGLDSHEHGHATLNLAIEDDQLSLEFESPAMNLTGFEHQPENDEQQAAIDTGISLLKQFNTLFVLSDSANCNLIEKSANWITDSDDGGHAEFRASYRLSCDAAKLEVIELPIFDHFPGIEEIEAQILLPGRQFAMELDSEHRRIQLR